MDRARTKRILRLVCCCVLILLAGYLLSSPPRIPPAVCFLGFTNAGTGLAAHFVISNTSTRSLDYNLCPAQSRNGGWWAHPQPATGQASRLLAGQSADFFASPPESGGTWRVPIEWYPLPTMGDNLRVRINQRIWLCRQGQWLAPSPPMYVQGYSVFTPELTQSETNK
jgi:hypothetical protein